LPQASIGDIGVFELDSMTKLEQKFRKWAKVLQIVND